MSASPAGEVLALEGALSFDTLPAVLLQSAEYAARTDLPERLTIDFSGITAVDSSAVALLLEWRRQAASRSKKLEFVNLPANLAAFHQRMLDRPAVQTAMRREGLLAA